MCKKILLLETVLCSRVTKVQLLQWIWVFAFFIQEYSIVLNLARKVQTLLHKMSFAGSTEDGLYWHVLCLNLENLSRGSRLTFCARFVALYFKFFTIFSSGVRVQNNSKGLSKPLRSQTISAASIHTVSELPHNLWCIWPGSVRITVIEWHNRKLHKLQVLTRSTRYSLHKLRSKTRAKLPPPVAGPIGIYLLPVDESSGVFC